MNPKTGPKGDSPYDSASPIALKTDAELEPSKTRRKRDMHALQSLGERLATLNTQQLDQLALPEALLEAVKALQRIRERGALRRQRQFIGKLMRTIDVGPIKAKLDAWSGESRLETARLHAIEHWRERLLADDEALPEFIQAFPSCDVQVLRTTIRNARVEQAASKPPKHVRQLFRLVREAMNASTNPVS